MKNILIFLLIFFNIIISQYGSTLTVAKFPNDIYTLNDKIELEVSISSPLSAENFILKEIKDFNPNNLTLIKTKIKVTTTDSEDKLLTSYHIIFIFKAVTKGKAFIPEINFLIISEIEEILKTKVIDLEIVSFVQKIKLPFQIFMSVIIILIIVISIYKIIQKKKENMRQLKQMIIYKNKKLEVEKEALKKFKVLGRYIIDGEYVKYSNEILRAFKGYFRNFISFPQRDLTVEDYRIILTPLLGKELNKQLEQFLNLIEEIQFAGKRPLEDDLNRIQLIAKEIIAKHRKNL